ncbi:MAG: YraN family protein [Bacteroidales bacterium]|nr:YraN family protein [Bacteroidales bacterium]MDY5823934.1 YraN family protein [Candidatus Coprenecus sp.]
MDRISIGKRGEEAAKSALEEMGFEILERNWRFGHKEIDIIAASEDGIRFVEVRSRVEPVLLEPELTVGSVKKEKLVSAARAYMRMNRITCEAFFDIVAVTFSPQGVKVDYFPDAFIPFNRMFI